MEKKHKSRPMQQIVSYLEKAGILIVRFSNDMLLNRPIEEWHRCDVLIGFYSFGFPLVKAIDYVNKFKPAMINDLHRQHELWDRTLIMEKLRKLRIPVAKSFVVLRGNDLERDKSG